MNPQSSLVNRQSTFPPQPPVADAGLHGLAHLPALDVFDKLDGWRLLLKQGAAYLRSRHRNEWSRLPPAVRRVARDHWLDGELVLPGEPATAVSRALAGGRGWERLRFRPFHLPGAGLAPRAEHAWLTAQGFEPPRYIGRFSGAEVVRRWPLWSMELVLQLGGEGLVLKLPQAKPVWFKLKRELSADLVVLDLLLGNGKFAGSPGALLCAVNGEHRRPAGNGVPRSAVHNPQSSIVNRQSVVRVSLTSLTTAERSRLGPADVGRICEVTHLGQTAAGSLRSPRFARWRDDLTIDDCGLGIPEL